MGSDFVYRQINPSIDEDVDKMLEIREDLNKFLKNRAKPLDKEQIKWLRIRMGAIEFLTEEQQQGAYAQGLLKKPDELCFVCELEGKVIGYIFVTTYHVIDGERPNDDIGIISDIYVKKEYRNSTIAFTLLQMGVKNLIKHGKNRTICNVQEDNENHYIHFALADGNVIDTSTCKRKNGTEKQRYHKRK